MYPGDCQAGIYEIEWGMKIKDFLELFKADHPHYILYNGYSGKCLIEKEFDQHLSGEEIKSVGAFMIFNKKRDILEIIQSVSKFFVNEFLWCMRPCRVGNYLLVY